MSSCLMYGRVKLTLFLISASKVCAVTERHNRLPLHPPTTFTVQIPNSSLSSFLNKRMADVSCCGEAHSMSLNCSIMCCACFAGKVLSAVIT